MTEHITHDLAVAYAQAKLIKNQLDTDYNQDSTNEEIRSFLESYHFALRHIPEEDKEIDLSTLE